MVQVQRPLAVVTATLDGDVLAILALAEVAFTTGQLQRMLPKGSTPGIRHALQRLVAQGIVQAEQVGRAWQYRLNREHLAAGPVIALANLRRTLLGRMEDELGGWNPRPVYAALFGSAARGDMRPDSDIDIFLVRPTGSQLQAWERASSAFADRVTRWTGNDARVLEMTAAEVAQRAGHEPVLDFIAKEGKTVCGSGGWLRKALAGAKVSA